MTTATKYFKYAWATEGGNTAPISDTDVSPVCSYQDGFTVNYEEALTVSGALPVPRGQTNQYLFDITSNLKNWQENGIYPFITASVNGGTAFPYTAGAVCAYDAGDGNGIQVWQSLVISNTQTPGAGTQWRSLSTGGIPIGGLLEFAGAAVPTNYFLCDGRAVSQTTYAALYAAIGDVWLNTTTPPGTGNFNIPDFRRFVSMGSGGTAGTAPGVLGTTVGSTGGQESHVQTAAEMAVHNHNGVGTVAGADNVVGGGMGFSYHSSVPGTPQNVAITMENAGGNGTTTSAMNITQPSKIITKCIRYA